MLTLDNNVKRLKFFGYGIQYVKVKLFQCYLTEHHAMTAYW